jgi:hypothetical protein
VTQSAKVQGIREAHTRLHERQEESDEGERVSESAYQVMPPLSPSEVAELRESIRKHGIRVPILVDSDGQVIDGHHRAELAAELGVPCPEQVATGTTADLRSLAYTLNLVRRHLTREEKRKLIERSLRSDPQLSNREHARRTGTSHNTVNTIREPLEKIGQIDHFPEHVDPRTGKASQPARKTSAARRRPTAYRKIPADDKVLFPAADEVYFRRLQDSAPDLLGLVDDGTLDFARVWSVWERREKAAKAIFTLASLADDVDVDLDVVLNAELVGPGMSLTPNGVASATSFLEQVAALLQ